MAIVLTVEDGTGLHNANSYVSVDDANTFNNQRPFATAWLAVGLEDKKRAIIMATRLLDEHIDWYGQSKKSHNLSLGTNDRQSLSWPRSGVFDPDGFTIDQDTMPDFIKDATAEFARFLAGEDRTLDPSTAGFSKIQLGSLSVDIDAQDRSGVLPRGVMHIVAPYGNPRFRGSAKLVRV